MGEYEIQGELSDLESEWMVPLKVRGMWNLSICIRVFLIWGENFRRVSWEYKQTCFHIAEILTLFFSYQNTPASSETNENSTHQNQIMFIMSRNGWKFWRLSAWWKCVDHFIFQTGKNTFWCKYGQRLFSKPIFCVINNTLGWVCSFFKYRGLHKSCGWFWIRIWLV